MLRDTLTDEEIESLEDINGSQDSPRRYIVTNPMHLEMLHGFLLYANPNYSPLTIEEIIVINTEDGKSIIDMEGQVELRRMYEAQENPPDQTVDANKFIYVTGFFVSLMFLIMSLYIHFMKE